jgi:S1-C subfamily serine protease
LLKRQKIFPDAQTAVIFLYAQNRAQSPSAGKRHGEFGQLMNQATIRPHMEDGRAAGISITGIKPNAIFRRMRLRNGDIITAVNSRPIDTVEDAVAVFEYLSSSTEI